MKPLRPATGNPPRTGRGWIDPTLLLLLGILCGCQSAGSHGGLTTESCEPTATRWSVFNRSAGSGCGSWCGYCGHCRKSSYNRCIDASHTSHAARKLAAAELHEMDPACATCDFRRGFEQAYIDVSQGASGAVPALPPPSYWKAKSRTPAGHQRAQEWFAGYAAGASRAVAYYGGYNQVASSGAPGYEAGLPGLGMYGGSFPAYVPHGDGTGLGYGH